MVDPSSIATLGVFAGAALIALGHSDAGLGVLVLGVVGYVVASLAGVGSNEPRP